MVMQLRCEKIFVWRGCIKNLCFSIHMTISTLLSYPCTIPETIVSPLWLFFALFYFHTLCAFLFNLSFSSRFLKFPSLTPLTPHLHLPHFWLPILCSLPSGLPTICYESSIFPWQNRWLLCFHLLSELALWKESLYLRGLHRLGRYVLCCSYRKKDLVWLEFLGPMGKSELVWVVTPFLTSPKQHAASLENSRNKASTVDS